MQSNIESQPVLGAASEAVQIAEISSRKEMIEAKQGKMGKWFGSEVPALHIALVIIVFFMLLGSAYTILAKCTSEGSLSIKDCWTMVLGVINIPIGFIFGYKKKS